MEDKKNNQVINEPERGDRSTLNQYQQSSIIKAIGVGGGGINAVNQMLFHIKDINYVVLDSDSQQLNHSPIPNRVLLETTHGHDSHHVTEENEAAIISLLSDNTRMAIIVARMGGDTGTDAAPVVARIAHEECLLTVGIVTIPFRFEGTQKIQRALAGVEWMRKNVDALFVIDNQCLTEFFNDLDQANAFTKSDETLTTAVRSLYEIIAVKNKLCIDFNDLRYTLHKGGQAMVFSGYAVGECRVTKALEDAFESPLLKDCDIYSSRKMMMNFYYNPDSESPLLMEEMNEVQAFMSNFNQDTDVIWGIAYDNTLEDQIKVTVLASGFNTTYGQYLASLLQDKSNQ